MAPMPNIKLANQVNAIPNLTTRMARPSRQYRYGFFLRGFNRDAMSWKIPRGQSTEQ